MKDEYGFSKTLNQVATWMIVSESRDEGIWLM